MSSKLRDAHDLETLLLYCHEKLKWPIDTNDFDDIEEVVYNYTAKDIGVEEKYFAKVEGLKQLRPLMENQPWGIFFITFQKGKLELCALKKIIVSLVRRKRADGTKKWDYDKLLFLCVWGGRKHKTVAFAAVSANGNSLPIIKLVSCSPASEDDDYLKKFEKKLAPLKWPPDEREGWVSSWSGIFARERNEVIKKSAYLVARLADFAKNIAKILREKHKIERASGKVNRWYETFRDSLCIDFTYEDFIDMYAQTIVYGLFSARCMAPADEFSLQTIVDYIPKTNPLLHDLFQEYSSGDGFYSYDELNIYEIVDLLKHADIQSIISDFNRQTNQGKEDPIVYFYESFLDKYERKKKKRLGVYYTPVPVVKFIVRSISHLLLHKLECEESFLSQQVTMLDPAAGTGTFLRNIILEAYALYEKRHGTSGWSDFLSNNMLPRLCGLELMMAPYAIAHMKIALTLKDTGYAPSEEPQRLRIYLANSLEEPQAGNRQRFCPASPLAKESAGLDMVHRHGINVVLGNPPYRSASRNNGHWIMDLMRDYKKEPGQDCHLAERNPKVVNDDYVKFVRLAQEITSREEKAVIGLVLAHSFIDSITFRGMRWSLLENFNEVYILNLHGHALNGESAVANVKRDDNIFDVKQGIAICFFVRTRKQIGSMAKVYYSELYGTRQKKLDYLSERDIGKIDWQEVSPAQPYYFYKPTQQGNKSTYEQGISLPALFPVNIGGIKTHKDKELISSHPFETEHNQLYAYRPFDEKFINYDTNLVKRHRFEVMQHFLGHENLGLVIDRQVSADNWSHISIVRNLVDNRYHYSTKGIPVVCPMYLYSEGGRRQPNLNQHLAKIFNKNLRGDTANISEIFNYCYGVLHSRMYRETYKTFLMIEFPRVPIPVSVEMFKEMEALGSKLERLHLLDEPIENELGIEFCGAGDNIVSSKVKYVDGRYYINKNQYFSNVPDKVSNFPHGGYRGMKKWIKDRRGMELSDADISHIISVWNVFKRTDDFMHEADAILLKYGMI